MDDATNHDFNTDLAWIAIPPDGEGVVCLSEDSSGKGKALCEPFKVSSQEISGQITEEYNLLKPVKTTSKTLGSSLSRYCTAAVTMKLGVMLAIALLTVTVAMAAVSATVTTNLSSTHNYLAQAAPDPPPNSHVGCLTSGANHKNPHCS